VSFERIVVMGASVGGVAAYQAIVRALPADFPAPILLVQHIGARRSILPQLLQHLGPLTARHPLNGERLVAGVIYVAPPDRHMTVARGRIELAAGPKENYTRPAIDPLLRSAAAAYGERVIGVVLTGGLDDGTAGLQAVKRCGGVAVVQDPAGAEEPSMPHNAMRFVDVDHCVPLAGIAPLLVELVRGGVGEAAGQAARDEVAYEQQLPAMEGDPMENLARIADPTTFVCPDCKGSLWRVRESVPPRFRCYTGHAYSLQSLEAAQNEGVDMALWNAVRALEEKYAILRERAGSAAEDRADLERHAAEVLELAHRLRFMVMQEPPPMGGE
jgi:two-component system chemotaxis response regulator CheB